MTMASGNFTSNSGVSANLYVVWSSTTNVAANTSSVTAVVYLRSYTMRFTALTNSYISINGNQLKFNGKVINKSSSSLTDTELARHTVTVAHNTDGTKSITITANLDFNGTVSGTSIDDFTASKTVTLDTIPRASGLSVASSINTGSTLTATITPANSAFTHKIEYFIDGVSKKVSGTIAAGTTTSSQLIEHAWLPSVNSATMTVRLYTYSGSTHIGTTDKSVAVTVPSNLMPTVSKLEATVINGLSSDGKVVSTGGYCVEGKSQVKLVATATPGSGSALASYEFSGANISGNASTYTTTSATVTTSIVRSNGSITYGVIAKDGRPNRPSTKVTTPVTVYPYTSPQITSITAQRCLVDGTIDGNGTYAKVTIKATYSPVGGANKRVVKLYNSKDNYATGTVVLSETNTNDTYTGVYGSGFEIGDSYTIRAVITDAYNTGTSIQASATLKVAERVLNIAKHGNGLAVGGFSSVELEDSSPKFECHWPTYIEGQKALTVGESEGAARLLTSVFVKNFPKQFSGYIGIRLGTVKMSSSSMVTIKGHVTSYEKSTSFEASCYFYAANNQFYGTSVTATNRASLTEICFAQEKSTGYIYLILGDSYAYWSYPTVVIDSVSIGFANDDNIAWDSGWTANEYTDFSSFENVTACTWASNSKVLWSGVASIGQTITLSENFRNFSFLTCIIGTTSEPYGIVLASFLDGSVAELHFGALFTTSGGTAGSNIYGAKFATSNGVTITLAGCGTSGSSNLSIRKIVGWR